MELRMDILLKDLFEMTQSLVNLVEQEDSDYDQWMRLFDERGQVMQDIQTLVEDGYIFTNNQKQQLVFISELDSRILPEMDIKKQGLKQKIGNIQQNKAVRQFYYNEGPSGYGAFFDQKK